MLKKAILSAGTLISVFLLWFAFYTCSQAVPLAEENLRGLALSTAAAIENLAVHDPSFAQLAKYHPPDIAYFALSDSRGIYRFHSNPDLIGSAAKGGVFPVASARSPDGRVTLGTGEQVYQFTAPLYLHDGPLLLRLALHTYRADAVIRRAKLNTTILLALLGLGWLLAAALGRYARREELHREEMARRENLARLGEMGALLAHEIRNPLSGIKGYAQVISRRPGDPRNSAFAGNIVTEAVRLENLVNDLLSYAATDHPAPAVFDLAGLLDHAVSLLAPDAALIEVEITRAYPHRLPVSGNRDRLEQVLLNLGKNALQAMPSGGVLGFEVEAAGNALLLKVQDTGDGMDEAALSRVFEPFFTTKARGTGLGLALCKKIIEQHAGSIGLASTAGQGTTVTLTLPLVMTAAGGSVA